MFLIEIFLPTFDNEGHKFSTASFDKVRKELTDRFGGVTAFMRSPATGLWSDDAGHVHRDELAIFEVMAASLDEPWWKEYRQALEERFRQQEILIRATQCNRI